MNSQRINYNGLQILWLVFGLILFSFAYLSAQDKKPLPKNDQCIICHEKMNKMPADYHENDVHLQEGLSCVGCHGGNAKATSRKAAESKAYGFIANPSSKEIPGLCGKCHSSIEIMRKYQPRIATDQVKQYYTSIHGQKLKNGDHKVAVCTSCHTAHAILPASDSRSVTYAENVPHTCNKCHGDADYMAEYGLSTNQYDEFAKSVHGKALLEDHDTGAPACNDCHGNHSALPPGDNAISHICGSCHVHNMEYFIDSKMGEAFPEEDLHDCIECHGNHDIEKTNDSQIGTTDDAFCADCHEEGDEGFATADTINGLLTTLSAHYDSARALQMQVQIIGLDDIDIGFLLKDAHQDLIESRTLIHTFEVAKVRTKTEAGMNLVKEAIDLAFQAKDDYKFRRLGFGVATFFITLLTIALFFKIRQKEKEKLSSK